MDGATRIHDAEARARAAGRSIGELCRAAGCHRSTWQRWKSGRGEPGVSCWARVEAFLASIEGGRSAATRLDEGASA